MVTTAAPDRRIDVIVLVVCTVALGTVIELYGDTWEQMPDWWRPVDITIGVAAIIALWWRDRYPMGVALLLGIVGGVSLTATLPILIGIWTVATRRPVLYAAVAAAAHLAVGIPYFLAFPLFDGPLIVWALVLMLLYTVIVTVGTAVRARRQIVTSALEAAERDRREFAGRLADVRRQERALIAREMHDVLAHRISLLSMHAGALQYRTAPQGGGRTPIDEAELHESVTVIRDSAYRAAEELRDVLSLLRDDSRPADDDAVAGGGDTAAADDEPGPGAPQPRLADLPRLVDEARAAGQRVELRCPPVEPNGSEPALDGADLRESVQRTVYRVVQEGLTNARKHAPEARVEVLLDAQPHRSLRVRVTNPLPVGVTESEMTVHGGLAGSGTGLTGLAERARIEGGELHSGVREGDFVLEAELPWRT